MANQVLDRVFSALSDPTRRAVLARLVDGEEKVSVLAEPFPMALPTVSRHLKVLERAGLVTRRIEGREHWIGLSPRALQAASDWLAFYRRFWGEGLDRLGRLMEEERDG